MRYKKCKANSINMIITFGNGKTEFNKKNRHCRNVLNPTRIFFWTRKNNYKEFNHIYLFKKGYVMIADQINLFRENIYAYTKDTFS